MSGPLDQPFELAIDSVDGYRSNGYVLIRNLASKEEIAEARVHISDSTNEAARRLKPMEERDTYGKAFIQHMNLWLDDPEIRAFTLSKRFAKVAAELMGVSGVRLYHDQALYKEPGGGHTPWHQDQQYWPLDGAKCVTMWMPLVDASAEMGTLKFAAGSQEIGYLGPMNISDDSESHLETLIHDRNFSIHSMGDMCAGDATFHDGWCIHGAPGNSSQNRTREVMTVIYFEDGVVVTEPDSVQRENDLKTWLPGIRPGELAASELNPVAYSG